MTDKQAFLGDVRSVKLALGRLDGLSLLPVVAAEAFEHLRDSSVSPVALANTVEMSPALAVRILSLAHSLGVKAATHQFSFSQILGRMRPESVRSAVLAASLYPADDEADAGAGHVSRLACVKHSLAVAHACRLVAQTMVVGTDANLAFMAGLLHDIGKLALHELMPRGFQAIKQQAEMSGSASCELEREYLGLDHGTLGKYLARKWSLPPQVSTAVWLHHSPLLKSLDRLPHVDMARIVFCADCLVCALDLGTASSSGQTPDLKELARLIRVNADQLHAVEDRLQTSTDLKASVARLEKSVSFGQLASVSQKLALSLSEKLDQDEQERGRMRAQTQELDFFRGTCRDFDVRAEPADFCVEWAQQWQRFFQTGQVCLFLVPDQRDQSVETVLVSGLRECNRALLVQPDEGPIVPKSLGAEPGIHAIYEPFDWIFEQLDAAFNPPQTRFVPLLFDKEMIGGLIFELNYPIDTEAHESLFIHLADLGATLLHAVLARQYHEELSDQVLGLRLLPETQDAGERNELVSALAEMAAGFAHELNNPLSVVAGRIQLLAQDEPDQEKKRVLRLIEENAHEISVMVDDLISYAEPSAPRPGHTPVAQVLDEAIQLAQHKSGRDDWHVSVEMDQDLGEVFVDSAQIASALANILVNSVEAYGNEIGEIKVRIEKSDSPYHVKLQIRDFGCGMDEDTLQNALTPFFSAKAAGRKRGMGLAFAARLIELNHGWFSLSSQLNRFTLATVWLSTRAGGS